MSPHARIGAAVAAVAVLALAACGRGDAKPADPGASPPIPRVSAADLDPLRRVFNGGVDGPRVIVFFSSGCASCDTGSAALQAMLGKVERPLTVLAVWEPVSPTDPPPTPAMLDNLVDPRVHQVWDPDHVLSAQMRAAELAHPSSPPQAAARMDKRPDGLIYDTAAVFPPGTRWDSTLPAPTYLGIGLEAHLDELRAQLEVGALGDLGGSLDPIRAEFNAHRGHSRFIAVLAPT